MFVIKNDVLYIDLSSILTQDKKDFLNNLHFSTFKKEVNKIIYKNKKLYNVYKNYMYSVSIKI